jgi:hypothetical protein
MPSTPAFILQDIECSHVGALSPIMKMLVSVAKVQGLNNQILKPCDNLLNSIETTDLGPTNNCWRARKHWAILWDY